MRRIDGWRENSTLVQLFVFFDGHKLFISFLPPDCVCLFFPPVFRHGPCFFSLSLSLSFTWWHLSEIRKNANIVFFFVITPCIYCIYWKKGYTCAKYIVNWHWLCESETLNNRKGEGKTICCEPIQPLPVAVKIKTSFPFTGLRRGKVLKEKKRKKGKKNWMETMCPNPLGNR